MKVPNISVWNEYIQCSYFVNVTHVEIWKLFAFFKIISDFFGWLIIFNMTIFIPFR